MVSLRICTLFLALVCVTTTVHREVYQVKLQGTKCKIEKVTDSTLSQALQSIRHAANNIRELDLSGNLLYQISAVELYPFRNLELLNLSSNVFYESVDLQSLSQLKTVDLNNNFMKEVIVPSTIVTLHAANNNISRVTCSGNAASPRSKRIYLANNKIGSLMDLSPECRTNVEYLDLSLNEIDMVEFSELSGSANSLRNLNMRYNFIFDIKNQQNVLFQQIDTVDLSSNKLAFMGLEFEAVLKATSIDLSKNKLVLIEEKLIFPTSIRRFDLRGNGFQCETLTKMIQRNKHLQNIAVATVRTVTGQDREQCYNTTRHVGPYCCEELSAPFADRLIAMKRKEHGLFSGQPSETDRAECEKENGDRQKAMDAIQKQYSTKIDEETRKNQEKIQLAKRKTDLENDLPGIESSYNELKDVIVQTAVELQIHVPDTPDLLELMRSITQRYEDLYAEEQNKQSNAMRDYELHQQIKEHMLEENARLKKANVEADLMLQNLNTTLQDLITREQNMAKALADAQN